MQFTSSYMSLPMTFHTWICSKLGSCASLSKKKTQGNLKDTVPASLFIRFTQEQLFSLILSWYRWERCAFEKLRIRLLFTCPSMSKLWLFWSSGSYLMLGLWSRHFPPARTWLSAQHNICFSKIFDGRRKVSKIRHFSWRMTAHIRDMEHYRVLTMCLGGTSIWQLFFSSFLSNIGDIAPVSLGFSWTETSSVEWG